MKHNNKNIYITSATKIVALIIFFCAANCVFADSYDSFLDYATDSLNSSVYIALGCGVTSGSSPVSYDPWPERLEDMLSGVSVVNLGDSRTYASDGAANINSYMKTYYPEYVLVLYGLNDIKPGIPNSVIIDNLETMVETAQAYGADVVLGTLPIVPNFTIYEASVVQSLNDDIRDMGSQYGIEIADVESVMGYRDSSLYIDGLHPTRTGYNMIAQEYYAHIFITTLSGDGTEASPYIISSFADFEEFYTNADLTHGYYILETDIDFGGQLFSDAIFDRAFTGNFDGQGHSISNFNIQCDYDYVGLFMELDGGVISSLNISSFSIIGGSFVGGICGQNDSGTIENCSSIGYVSGEQYVGGLTGYNYYGLLEECRAISNVTGDEFVGGLLGKNYDGTVRSCYSTGSVNGNRYVGGLIGHTGYGLVSDSYSESSVSGVDYVGGFCGRSYHGDVQNCYSSGSVSGTEYVGGFTGSETNATLSSCYWNVSSSGVTNSAGGIGKTDEEMRLQTTYVQWDFSNIWYMSESPLLRSFGSPLTGDGTIESPYILSDFSDFHEFYTHDQLIDGYYMLTTNIDLGGQMFNDAIVNRDFTGNFDGHGHTVSNFTIQSTNDYVGLFSILDGGVINSLTVSLFDISGGSFVGGVCGQNKSGTIESCISIGDVNGYQYTGGLTGHNSYGLISSSSANGSVVGGDYTGGFCGRNYKGTMKSNQVDSIVSGLDFTGGFLGSNYEGTLEDSYSIGTITGDRYVGGLIGHTGYGLVSDSYSESSVSGVDYVGGFCGRRYHGDVNNCYSSGSVSGTEYVGGFTGSETNATLSSCYWNVSSSGVTNSAGGVGKTDLDMQIQSTFADWDFSNKWYMVEYPQLRCLGSSFDIWLTDSGAPVNERNWYDDPAGDNIENIWKYASGLDLLAAYSITNVFYYDSNSNTFDIIYYKSKSADATIIPEWKYSLLDESWMTNSGLINLKISETADREKWKASVPTSSNGFIRIKAEIQVK